MSCKSADMGKYINVSTRLAGRGLQYRSERPWYFIISGRRGESILAYMGLQAAYAGGNFLFLKLSRLRLIYQMPCLILVPFRLFSDSNSSSFYAHSRHCSSDLKHSNIISILYMFKKPLSVYTKLTVWLPISALLVFHRSADWVRTENNSCISNRKIFI